MRAVLLASLATGSAGHGMMTLPFSRNGGTLAIGGTIVSVSTGAAEWYTNNVQIPGKATLPEEFETTIYGKGKTNPWRAPGSAPIKSPCGNLAPKGGPGSMSGGIPGETLPRLANRTVWQRGTAVRAAWAIFNNHGGGYSYRLCPAKEKVTEACFQQYPLQFADDTSAIHFALDGKNALKPEVPFKVKTLSTGTTPAGSQWRRNPIPSHEEQSPFKAPCPGCEGDMNGFSVVDNLAVPKDIPTGDYLLSWRWDTEDTPQIWANCADITITDGAGPAPTPPAPKPAATTYGCSNNECVSDPAGVPKATCVAVCHP